MSGIIFYKTQNLNELREFYSTSLGMETWLEQKDCIIFKDNNMLLGFCQRDEVDTAGMITFFYPTVNQVGAKFQVLKSIALAPPEKNNDYAIYQFFARDPENRMLEFQSFLHELPPYLQGDELMLTRRSIRHFQDRRISREILSQIFGQCRFAPTSRNSQSYYFLVIEKPETLKFLATRRNSSSAPIGRAPLAVAVCADNEKTLRPEQDGCIAAYHFILSAWNFGLGTCWIAAMDRDDVKQELGIPKHHYVATVTPLGYPASVPEASGRRGIDEFVRFIR